ncbi:MAG: phosphoenolpyruvate carboxykinase (GTP) [Oligoflexales bacterium]|nr:phosphoenolpyruvate carboxykinase (GTP) [Oligoflexales bacterium]
MATTHEGLKKWVDEVATLTRPSSIHWCDGSQEEYDSLVQELLKTGELLELNQSSYPRCYLHRSHPTDVARTEHLTYVSTKVKEDVGPNNNWMSPADAHKKMDQLFASCMEGRTLYVIPYCMGPLNSPHARCGVEITDSAYVVLNMRIMTRMGKGALQRIESEKKAFVKGLHSTGDFSVDKRFIMHFPEDLLIKSFGSGYGGNALLGKKCHALRLASYQGRQEGWLAEHMLIVGIQPPNAPVTYIAAAFPSACGKTNLAMLIPPEEYKGWKVWTVGDDIAWMHIGQDGRLYAINPESGYFGVAPGTSPKTNPNAVNMLKHDSIFTNVAMTAAKEPWWEGLNAGSSDDAPVWDWQGRPYNPEQGTAAQANSRFTVSAKQCASYSPEAENPEGVPISAIIFGGRRPHLIPLVYEAKSWQHGVLVGASVASETTAASTETVGVLRRDPMAMKPFCGYNFGDYWTHWLSLSKKASALPKIFHVNWFRQKSRRDGKKEFIWPGFSENMRVLEWILKRVDSKCEAVQTPIGYVPHTQDLNLKGLNLSPEDLKELCDVNPHGWKEELEGIRAYFSSFQDRLPPELQREAEQLARSLSV